MSVHCATCCAGGATSPTSSHCLTVAAAFHADTRQALIQYIDASAAQAALRASENRQIRLQNMIITVEPYLRRQDAGGGGGGYGSVSDAAWDGDSSTGHPSRPPSQYGPSPSQVGSLAGSMHNGAARASDAGALLEEAMPEALPEALPEVSRLGLHNGGGGGSGGAAAVYENGLNLEELQDCVCCPITHDVFRVRAFCALLGGWSPADLLCT